MGIFQPRVKYNGFYGDFNRMRCTCTNWTLSALICILLALKSHQFQNQTPKVSNIFTL